MIDPRELRVGNLFDYHGQTVHLMDVITSGAMRPRAAFCYFTDSIGFVRYLHEEDFPKPIPLSAEWLERAGFKKVEHSPKWYAFSDIGIVFERSGSFSIYLNTYSISIQHVHRLQNLFFELRGTELEFKPKQ